MKHDTSIPALSPLLPHGTISVAECVRRIEADVTLSPTRRRDMASALRRLALALGDEPERLPAALSCLQPRIRRISPAALKLRSKTWANILSNATAAFAHCGQARRLRSKLEDLSPAWRTLWKALLSLDDIGLRTGLRRFVTFADRSGIAPEDVTEVQIEDFRLALVEGEIHKRPGEIALLALYGWNRAVDRVAGWPSRRLEAPSSPLHYAVPLASLPLTFAEDLERFRQRLSDPDPLDATAPARPLREATVRSHIGQVTRLASALVHAGVAADRITDLAVLTQPDNAKLAIRWLHGHFGGRITSGLANLVRTLAVLIRYHSNLSDTEREQALKLLGRFRIRRPPGMTDKNRDRLRALSDPAQLARLLCLPDHLWKEASELSQRRPREASLLREVSLALSILSYCPIRLHNLTTCHLKENIRRIGRTEAMLVFAGRTVKNGRTLEFPLPREIVARIDEHVRSRAGLLCPPGTDWLFPRRDGGAPVVSCNFGSRISKTIRERIGLEVNAHLYRHLAATLLLDARPGDFDTARLLLGHSQLSNTIDCYAGHSAAAATTRYGELVSCAKHRKES